MRLLRESSFLHPTRPPWQGQEKRLIDGSSGYFLSHWDANVHLLVNVNVNVPEKMTSRSLNRA